MKKRNEDGWPRAPPNRTLPAFGLAITVAAQDEGDASAAATEDDDKGGDKTPAASTRAESKIHVRPKSRARETRSRCVRLLHQ